MTRSSFCQGLLFSLAPVVLQKSMQHCIVGGMASEFGSLLRRWRLDAGLSQRELARRAGLDFTYLSKIEGGLVAPPSEDRIRGLVRALGHSAEDVKMLLNLARQSRIQASDVKATVIKHPEVGALLRRIKERPLTAEETEQIRRLASGNETTKPDEELPQ
jgi:HTH-type transcriptional regulator, competence development regulator